MAGVNMPTWMCPLCDLALEQTERVLACASGHSFDMAKEGYVNLLVGRQKPGERGDSPEMLAARRRFFESGSYEPLRSRLVQIVAGLNKKVVVESGCGEGYYIGGVSEHISSSKCLATDIAKDGVRLAAKRYGKVKFAVADTNQKLPLADGSVDVLLDIFAPRNRSEFRRILTPGGKLVVVIPTPNHLERLREVYPLIEIQPEKQRAAEETLAGSFILTLAETLTVPMKLEGPVLVDLVAMTPSARFMDDAGTAKLRALLVYELTAEFRILQFSPLA